MHNTRIYKTVYVCCLNSFVICHLSRAVYWIVQDGETHYVVAQFHSNQLSYIPKHYGVLRNIRINYRNAKRSNEYWGNLRNSKETRQMETWGVLSHNKDHSCKLRHGLVKSFLNWTVIRLSSSKPCWSHHIRLDSGVCHSYGATTSSLYNKTHIFVGANETDPANLLVHICMYIKSPNWWYANKLLLLKTTNTSTQFKDERY